MREISFLESTHPFQKVLLDNGWELEPSEKIKVLGKYLEASHPQVSDRKPIFIAGRESISKRVRDLDENIKGNSILVETPILLLDQSIEKSLEDPNIAVGGTLYLRGEQQEFHENLSMWNKKLSDIIVDLKDDIGTEDSGQPNVWITVGNPKENNQANIGLFSVEDTIVWAVPEPCKRGDIVIIWVTRMGIKYIAKIIEDPIDASDSRWGPVHASLKIDYLLDPAISMTDLKENRTLKEWNLVKRNMQGAIKAQKAPINSDKDVWNALYKMLTSKFTKIKDFLPPPLVSRTYVPTQTDDPAVIDLLGRRDLAIFIAEELNRINLFKGGWLRRIAKSIKQFITGKSETKQGSFILHLDGPWGSGKTSLLYFIREILEKPDKNSNSKHQPWIVVDFNAWQHQRFGDPWWWMSNRVSSQARKRLFTIWKPFRALWIWIMDKSWMYLKGRVFEIFILVIISISLTWLFISLFPGIFKSDGAFWAKIFTMNWDDIDVNNLKSFATFVTVFIAIFSFIGGKAIDISRRFTKASGETIRHMIRGSQDPIHYLQKHFNHLIKIIKYNVLIMVDDLDRCQSDYVVKLLEGIQTIFRNCPICFIISADRKWVSGSYASVYEGYNKHVSEHDRDLKQLFIEKIFQASVSVPRLSQDARKEYFKYLIGDQQSEPEPKRVDGNLKTRIHRFLYRSKKVAKKKDDTKNREKARSVLSNMTTSEEIVKELKKEDENRKYKEILIEEGMRRLASKQATEVIEKHLLENYVEFLEQNPRAIKRFLNAYRFNQAIALVLLDPVPLDQLVRWTIITLRWPKLADYLSKNCTNVECMKSGIEKVDKNLQPFFLREEVIKVFMNKEKSEFILGPEEIKKLVESAYPY